MKGPVCLITGATSGIGKVTALTLAGKGYHVIIHGRDLLKVLSLQKEIVEKTGNKEIDYLCADLTSMEQVKKMADEFKNRYNHLDILINNAGAVMNNLREITEDGFEKTIALNYLTPFLLTNLLLEPLKRSDQARIINISSEAHKYGKPDFNDFFMKSNYSAMKAYGNAKLYVIMFTEELKKRLEKAGIKNIIVNSLHPGVIKTNFALESNSLMKVFFTIGSFFLKTPEQGAKTTLYLAQNGEVLKFSGLYFKDAKPVPVKHKFITEDNSHILWEISEEATKKKFLI